MNCIQGIGLERLRAILVRVKGTADRAALFCDSVWKPFDEEDLKKVAGFHKDLNSSQLAAVQHALTNTFTLWQGPPGTKP